MCLLCYSKKMLNVEQTGTSQGQQHGRACNTTTSSQMCNIFKGEVYFGFVEQFESLFLHILMDVGPHNKTDICKLHFHFKRLRFGHVFETSPKIRNEYAQYARRKAKQSLHKE